MDDLSLPAWAARIRAEREARGWSQRDAVRNLPSYAPVRPDGRLEELPSETSLLRQWKGWEAGDHRPSDEFYAPMIARMFGTVTAALFPPVPVGESELVAATGMDTLELVSRMRASAVDQATLDALRITGDRLCSEYPYMPAAQLKLEGQQWLRRVLSTTEQRLTLSQHREILSLAGLIALLVGCVEYDTGDRAAAEATRRAALSLGEEAGDRRVVGWAHEMSAWFHLTQGNYRGVIEAAEMGIAAAGERSVSVQLAAQKAKAWARIGDRRQVELALEQGRSLLEKTPYPANLDHHFVVDPGKFDFYAMDCYRLVGADRLTRTYANEILRTGTGVDGTERTPMRNAEARISLGVVAAREGELAEAVTHGTAALTGERKSLPTLLMVGHELARVLQTRYPTASDTREYVEQLRAIMPHPAGFPS